MSKVYEAGTELSLFTSAPVELPTPLNINTLLEVCFNASFQNPDGSAFNRVIATFKHPQMPYLMVVSLCQNNVDDSVRLIHEIDVDAPICFTAYVTDSYNDILTQAPPVIVHPDDFDSTMRMLSFVYYGLPNLTKRYPVPTSTLVQ